MTFLVMNGTRHWSNISSIFLKSTEVKRRQCPIIFSVIFWQLILSFCWFIIKHNLLNLINLINQYWMALAMIVILTSILYQKQLWSVWILLTSFLICYHSVAFLLSCFCYLDIIFDYFKFLWDISRNILHTSFSAAASILYVLFYILLSLCQVFNFVIDSHCCEHICCYILVYVIVYIFS